MHAITMAQQEGVACAGLVRERKREREILVRSAVLSERHSLHPCPGKSLYHGKFIWGKTVR